VFTVCGVMHRYNAGR